MASNGRNQALLKIGSLFILANLKAQFGAKSDTPEDDSSVRDLNDGLHEDRTEVADLGLNNTRVEPNWKNLGYY